MYENHGIAYRSQDSLQKLILIFHHVGPEGHTQGSRLIGKAPSPAELSHQQLIWTFNILGKLVSTPMII